MSRSQHQKRVNYGLDSGDYTDRTSSYGPRPQSGTAPAAPSGTQTVGSTLTAAANPTFVGSAQGGTITVTKQWVRGDSRTPIGTANSNTYVLVTADKTHRVRVRYIAKNKLGEWWVESSPTGIIP